MKNIHLRPMPLKRVKKSERERQVLLGLIELYLKTGQPIGSNTLKEAGFHDLSSATIRNYFANLEDAGYLKQQHASGGRVPTWSAYKLYATEHVGETLIDEKDSQQLLSLQQETKEIAAYLQEAAERLSAMTGCAVFLSAPRFDHDFVLDIKLVGLDERRCLCILLTDFGSVLTEVLHTERRLSSFALKRIESYFQWRLKGHAKPANLEEAEEKLAQQFYNEVMLRYIIRYSTFTDEDVYRTGFSRLLGYPEFNQAAALAKGLALFENITPMRDMLRKCESKDKLTFWIGEDLSPYLASATDCAVIAIPYRIHHTVVGAAAILGPTRMPYRKLFGLLRAFSEHLSQGLSKSLYKFKIQFRQPEKDMLYLEREECLMIAQSSHALLEDKRPSKE